MLQFACDKCDTVDQSGLAPLSNHTPSGQWLCICCLGGEWHNLFPKQPFNPEVDIVCNRPSGVGLG